MVKEIKLPVISENVDTADVISVLVSKGEMIEIDQSIIEVETDKASFDVPSTESGKVTEVLVKENETINVGQIIIKVETDEKAVGEAAEQEKEEPEKEEISEPEKAVKTEPPTEAVVEVIAEKAEPRVEQPVEPEKVEPAKEELPAARENAPAAPTVRRLARELGVDIHNVRGSGPGGRISMEDVKKHVKEVVAYIDVSPAATTQPLPDFSRWGEIEREKISTVRKITAETMSHAWTTVPHVTQFDAADITELHKFIQKYGKKVEKAGAKLTITAILIKVVAAALKTFPRFNASIDMNTHELIYKKYYHISIAVDTDRGLLVPVIRDVDKKGIVQLAVELSEIAEKTRNKKIAPEDLEGGTFTISNQGGIGGTNFTPIVYWPQAAIMGVSRSTVEPVYNGEQFEPRTILPISLSYDHRIIDGADAARFLRWVKEALEHPLLLVFE